MANDSTTSSKQSEMRIKPYASPRPATVSFLCQFARAYSILGGVTLGSMIAN